MYERWVNWGRNRRLDRQFSGLEGEYEECERAAGGAFTKTGGVIKLTYCRGTKFETEGITERGEKLWRGVIFMKEEAGVLGAGYYSYLKRDDTGIQRLIYNSEANHFNVSGENTSHIHGKHDFK